jgi:hypothetical protein
MKKAFLFLPLLLSTTLAWGQTTTATYRCVGNKSVKVTYWSGEATASAKVVLDGKPRTLQYDRTSNAETIVFKDGPYSLHVENNKKNIRNVKGVMIFKEMTEIVNNQKMPVSQLLFKDCNPR